MSTSGWRARWLPMFTGASPSDPPPDIAVEVDVSGSSLDKLSIYEALGVPEVWS